MKHKSHRPNSITHLETKTFFLFFNFQFKKKIEILKAKQT